jgi:hypothetical protein
MFELKKFSHRKEAIVVILILAATLAILYFAKFAGLELKQLDGADVLAIISTMFVVAVFMERSVEAILIPIRTPDKQKIEQKLKIAKKVSEAAEADVAAKVEIAKAQTAITEAEKAVLAAQTKGTPDAAVAARAAEATAQEASTKATANQATAMAKAAEATKAAETVAEKSPPILAEDRFRLEQELETYRLETAQHAYWLSFGFGLAISLVGVRALATLVEPGSLVNLSESHRTFFSFVDVLLTGGVIAGGSAAIDKIGRRISQFFNLSSATDPKPQSNPSANQ